MVSFVTLTKSVETHWHVKTLTGRHLLVYYVTCRKSHWMNQWTNQSRYARKNQKSLGWIQIIDGPQQFKHLVTEAFWGIFIWGLVRDGDDQVGFFLLWQWRQNYYIITALTVITTSVMLCCWSSETREALVHISLWFSKQAERTLLTGWSSAWMFWANNILTVHHMSVENLSE